MSARTLVFATLLVIAPGGCRRQPLPAGVSDSAFVAAMAELQRLQRDRILDSADRAAARDSILRRNHLTAAQLQRAADALATDPDHALALWRAIDRRAARPSPRSPLPRRPPALPAPTPRGAVRTPPKT